MSCNHRFVRFGLLPCAVLGLVACGASGSSRSSSEGDGGANAASGAASSSGGTSASAGANSGGANAGAAGSPSSGAGASGGNGGEAGDSGAGGQNAACGGSGGSAGSGTRPVGDDETACGMSDRGVGTEGRPRACVSTPECTALTVQGSYSPFGTAPSFTPGDITEIELPIAPIVNAAGIAALAFDPNNTAILYVGVEQLNGVSADNGLWKSVDGGTTFTQLGTGEDSELYDCKTGYLDLPIHVAVDPLDATHLYATSGVRGAHNGFWVSWDSGETWMRAYDGDLTAMSVDPCDFCHVIVGSHTQDPIGVLETYDGGANWTVHPPTFGGWSGGTYGLSMLYDPKSCQGDGKTWLVHNGDMWRTSDAGDNWSKVSDADGVHGSTEIYYAKDGTLYSGAFGFPMRSTDNGLTWTETSDGLNSGVYYGVTGDGEHMYVMPDGYPPSLPLMVSDESDGSSWQAYPPDSAIMEHGMNFPRFDAASGILYFLNVKAQALKVTDF
jgi:hypothetical protein